MAEQRGKFPFDAFDADDSHNGYTPNLRVFNGWTLQANRPQAAKTADFTIADDDPDVFVVDASSGVVTATLPTLADNQGRSLTFVLEDATNKLTVDGEGAETINGQTAFYLYGTNQVATIFAGPTEWVLLTPLYFILDIGDWDMDTTVQVNISHGLTDETRVRHIGVSIRHDNDQDIFDFKEYTAAATTDQHISVGSGVVTLVRSTGGQFDSTSFDSTSFNRGFIRLEYLAGG